MRLGAEWLAVAGLFAWVMAGCNAPSQAPQLPAATASSATAQSLTVDLSKEPTGFHGIPWGAAEKTVKKKEASRTYAMWDCYPVNFGARGCQTFMTMGETLKVTARYVFVRDKLVEVDIAFQASDWPTMKSALVERYGPPTEEQHSSLRNAMNAEFESEALNWTWPKVLLHAKQRESTINEGQIHLLLVEWNKELGDLVAKKTARAAAAF